MRYIAWSGRPRPCTYISDNNGAILPHAAIYSTRSGRLKSIYRLYEIHKMTKKTKIKVEFAPGAFDQFEGTQEELDEFVAEIQRMADSGELEEQSVSLDSDEAWDQLSEEEKAIISASLNKINNTRH